MQTRPDEDDLLSLLYPETLEPSERADLTRRVAEDPELSAKLAAWRTVQSVARTGPTLPPPPRSVRTHVLREARAAAEQRARSNAPARPGLFDWTRSFGPALAGAFGLVLAVGGVIVLSSEDAPEAALETAPSPVAPTLAAAPAVVAVSLPGAIDAPRGAPAPSMVPQPEAKTRGDLGDLKADRQRVERPADLQAPAATTPKPKRPEAAAFDEALGAAQPGTGNGAAMNADVDADDGRVQGSPDPFPGADRPTAQSEREAARRSPVAKEAQRDEGKAESVADALEGEPAQYAEKPAPMEESVPRKSASYAAAPAAAPAPPPPPAEPIAGGRAAGGPAQAAGAAASPELTLARAARDAGRLDEAARRYDGVVTALRRAQGASEAQKRSKKGLNTSIELDDAPAAPSARDLGLVLYETAEVYERLGDLGRAGELYRLAVATGGPFAARAAARLDALGALRREAARPRPASDDSATSSPSSAEPAPASQPAVPME
jgi:hypothetical protein